MTKEVRKDKFIPSFDKKDENKLDFYISSSEDVDIKLTEQESIKLLVRLKNGPNEKAQQFALRSKRLYEENKKKVQSYLEKT